MSVPRFAVVGHPNKGKSSIVATLARDDRVAVSPVPGTTVRADAYPMSVGGQVLYELVDTPGFQRSRRVLADLRARAATADERPAAVRAFLDDPATPGRYPDEHALLGAVMGPSDEAEPAGILYVVDGSAPYGPEYEAEMEVLRWTGAPSLGLINPFDAHASPGSDHTAAWERALGQYFRIVRVFDPLTADHAKRLGLLRAFGQMREPWRAPLERAVEVLERDAAGRREDAAGVVARAVVAAMRFSVEKRLPPTGDPAAYRGELMEAWADGVRSIEARARDAVEELYDFVRLEREEEAAAGVPGGPGGADGPAGEDLFAEGSWSRFGATPAQLAATGAVFGGGVGVLADLHFAGLSLGAAAAAGALIGGATAWAGATKAAKMKVLGRDLGGRLARVGPSGNLNLAFVLLGRARLHLAAVRERTHARRDRLVVPSEGEAWARADRSAVAAALKPVMKKPADDAAAAESARALKAWLLRDT